MKISLVQCWFFYRLLFKLVFTLSVIQMVRTKSKPQVKILFVTKTQTTKADDSLINLHDLNAHLNLENSVIMEDFVQRFQDKTPQPNFFERLHDVTFSRSQCRVQSFIDFGPYKDTFPSLLNMQMAWKEAYTTMQVWGGIPQLTVTSQLPMKKRAEPNHSINS